ncbi:hypothetical protein AAC691_12820 [Nguyenibacter vanlangensis]|uniref:Uncharacterized protein n=1 Tax=Nguyenibacter vanlangensis TaxID=1216886 RepID=A0ABZ3D0C4_9PROT
MMREPTPGQHVAGIIEHMLPFAAVGVELWRLLIEKFIASMAEMRAADLETMAARPERLNTRPDRDALYERVRDRTATLIEDLRRAEDMPRGWFSFTPTAKRRLSAIDKAQAAEREWSEKGAVRFLQSEAAKLDRAVRRQDKKIRDFDSRPEVQGAARRLDDYPGAVRMAEGLRELKPDEELFKSLSPAIGQDGGIVRVNARAGLELLRRRVAIAAATRGAAAGKGGSLKEKVEIVPELEVAPEPEQDDRPDMPDDDSLMPTGLLM